MRNNTQRICQSIQNTTSRYPRQLANDDRKQGTSKHNAHPFIVNENTKTTAYNDALTEMYVCPTMEPNTCNM